MPILKGSKHFTRSWRRRGGDRVTKQLHKCFSQTLHNYTSIHQHKVTSIAHTLPLSLSLSIHTHTHHPHHTHTYTGQIRQIWANQILGGEEIGFKCRPEGVNSRSISNVLWQWVPDRRTKVREGTITFCLALTDWNFEEAVVSTWAKRLRRRVQM